MAHDVFISYPSENKAIADAVCAGLEAEQIRCWIAPRDVLGGSNYGESIIGAIESARVMVLICSSATNVSAAVIREAERAMHFGKPIIPFRIEDVPIARGLEFYLASCHWLEAVEPPIEKHIAPLASAILSLLGNPVPVAKKKSAHGRGPVHWKIKAGLLFLVLVAVLVAGLKLGPGLYQKEVGSHSVTLDYAVFGQGQDTINDFFQPGARLDLAYEKDGPPDRPVIKPTALWLQQCRTGTSLPAVDMGTPTPQSDGSVLIDFKVLNSSAKTISITDVVAKVEESSPIIESLQVVDLTGLRAGSFRLLNLGRAPTKAGQVAYKVQPSGEAATANTPLAVAHFEAGQSNPLVDVSIQPQLDALRTRGAKEAVFYADIESEGGTVPSKDTISPASLQQIISLSTPRSNLGTSTPSGDRDIVATLVLRDQGENYPPVREGISRVIEPGESDRFQVALSAPTSSHHRLNLQLFYSDGTNHVLDSGPLEIEMIVPHLQ